MYDYDVIVVGVGLSAIGAARQLQDKCPRHRFAILESCEALGGTWDPFRYPGIRSDSDRYTMGYGSRPWREPQAIADGPPIPADIREAATERGIDRAIRFDSRVTSAHWWSDGACWTLEVEHPRRGGTSRHRCNMLLMCCGYYRYEEGHRPHFEGEERYRGVLVRPQHWPANLDYTGRRAVTIGSGATAITLVPAMAQRAAHVTLLQRSPGYVVALPARLAYRLARWKSTRFQLWVYGRTRARPTAMKQKLIGLVRRRLGSGYDVARHFAPRYPPWNQRLCVARGGDFFAALRAGRATIVTATIARFEADGIVLASGEHLAADVVIAATDLAVTWLGEARVSVDDEPVDFAQRWAYKGRCSRTYRTSSTRSATSMRHGRCARSSSPGLRAVCCSTWRRPARANARRACGRRIGR